MDQLVKKAEARVGGRRVGVYTLKDDKQCCAVLASMALQKDGCPHYVVTSDFDRTIASSTQRVADGKITQLMRCHLKVLMAQKALLDSPKCLGYAVVTARPAYRGDAEPIAATVDEQLGRPRPLDVYMCGAEDEREHLATYKTKYAWQAAADAAERNGVDGVCVVGFGDRFSDVTSLDVIEHFGLGNDPTRAHIIVERPHGGRGWRLGAVCASVESRDIASGPHAFGDATEREAGGHMMSLLAGGA